MRKSWRDSLIEELLQCDHFELDIKGFPYCSKHSLKFSFSWTLNIKRRLEEFNAFSKSVAYKILPPSVSLANSKISSIVHTESIVNLLLMKPVWLWWISSSRTDFYLLAIHFEKTFKSTPINEKCLLALKVEVKETTKLTHLLRWLFIVH